MTRLFQGTWILPIILASVSFCQASLNLTYEWKYIDYLWKCNRHKAAAVADGTNDYTKIILNDVQPLPDGRILVTTPRYFDNPASLSTISDRTGNGGPLLAPYPDWSWHKKTDCSGITSVNRVFLDDYDRLWLVDSGKIANEQVCPAKILAFDVYTDELLVEVEIPEELSHNAADKSRGLLEIFAVETSGGWSKTWVYISDIEGYGLIIWDGSVIWRLNADAFLPDPNQEIFTINGQNITLNLGISGILSPHGYLRKPALIFKPMTGVKAYAVNLKDLHNSKSGFPVTFYRSDFTAPNQEISRAFSKEGGVLIAAFSMGLIACWNMQNPLKDEYIAYLDSNVTNLQFVNGIKITKDSQYGPQTVWAISNELQQIIRGTIDWNSINFRILSGDVATLVSGTVCEPNDGFEVVNDIKDKAFVVYQTTRNALYKRYFLHEK